MAYYYEDNVFSEVYSELKNVKTFEEAYQRHFKYVMQIGIGHNELATKHQEFDLTWLELNEKWQEQEKPLDMHHSQELTNLNWKVDKILKNSVPYDTKSKS